MTKCEAIQAIEAAEIEILLNTDVGFDANAQVNISPATRQVLDGLGKVRAQIEAEEPFLPMLDGHGNERG